MQQQIGERIDALCMKEGISRRKFAEIIGENPSTIASIIRGTNPSSNIICSILEHYPKLNERWLLMGEGQIYKDESSSSINNEKEQDALRDQLAAKNDTIEALKGQVSALNSLLELHKKQIDALLEERDKFLKIGKKVS